MEDGDNNSNPKNASHGRILVKHVRTQAPKVGSICNEGVYIDVVTCVEVDVGGGGGVLA